MENLGFVYNIKHHDLEWEEVPWPMLHMDPISIMVWTYLSLYKTAEVKTILQAVKSLRNADHMTTNQLRH